MNSIVLTAMVVAISHRMGEPSLVTMKVGDSEFWFNVPMDDAAKLGVGGNCTVSITPIYDIHNAAIVGSVASAGGEVQKDVWFSSGRPSRAALVRKEPRPVGG